VDRRRMARDPESARYDRSQISRHHLINGLLSESGKEHYNTSWSSHTLDHEKCLVQESWPGDLKMCARVGGNHILLRIISLRTTAVAVALTRPKLHGMHNTSSLLKVAQVYPMVLNQNAYRMHNTLSISLRQQHHTQNPWSSLPHQQSLISHIL